MAYRRKYFLVALGFIGLIVSIIAFAYMAYQIVLPNDTSLVFLAGIVLAAIALVGLLPSGD
jgi:hypothetical protein